MKTNNKSLWVGLISLCFLFGSCSDWLDVDIRSSIVAGDFPANGEEANALLLGVYRDLKEDMNSTAFHLDRSDAFDVGVVGTVTDYWAQFINSSNGPSWTGFYSALHNVNLFLSEVDDLDYGNETDRRQAKAEALFLRAFYYFYMAKIWGDVPLRLVPTLSPNQEVIGRTPVDQVFTQIKLDLDESLDLFPNATISERYFASKPAAYALKADVYMWTGKVLNGGESDFDVALDAIQEIENAGLALLDDFGSVFDERGNSELIFTLFNDRDEQVLHYASRLSVREVNLDPNLSPGVPWSSGFDARHNYSPSQLTRELFSNPEDKRADRTFLPFYLSTGDTPVSYSQNKFRGEIIDGIRTWTDDLIMYRWGDMVLLRAEAYAAKNELENAVVSLNAIRNRAGIGDYEGEMDQLRINREILDERGRELFLEPKRWWDLRRFHADGTIDLYEYIPNLIGNETPLYWSISDGVIAQNELITQTEGY